MLKVNEQQGAGDDSEYQKVSDAKEKPLDSTAQTPKKISAVEKEMKGEEPYAQQELIKARTEQMNAKLRSQLGKLSEYRKDADGNGIGVIDSVIKQITKVQKSFEEDVSGDAALSRKDLDAYDKQYTEAIAPIGTTFQEFATTRQRSSAFIQRLNALEATGRSMPKRGDALVTSVQTIRQTYLELVGDSINPFRLQTYAKALDEHEKKLEPEAEFLKKAEPFYKNINDYYSYLDGLESRAKESGPSGEKALSTIRSLRPKIAERLPGMKPEKFDAFLSNLQNIRTTLFQPEEEKLDRVEKMGSKIDTFNRSLPQIKIRASKAETHGEELLAKVNAFETTLKSHIAKGGSLNEAVDLVDEHDAIIKAELVRLEPAFAFYERLDTFLNVDIAQMKERTTFIGKPGTAFANKLDGLSGGLRAIIKTKKVEELNAFADKSFVKIKENAAPELEKVTLLDRFNRSLYKVASKTTRGSRHIASRYEKAVDDAITKARERVDSLDPETTTIAQYKQAILPGITDVREKEAVLDKVDAYELRASQFVKTLREQKPNINALDSHGEFSFDLVQRIEADPLFAELQKPTFARLDVYNKQIDDWAEQMTEMAEKTNAITQVRQQVEQSLEDIRDSSIRYPQEMDMNQRQKINDLLFTLDSTYDTYGKVDASMDIDAYGKRMNEFQAILPEKKNEAMALLEVSDKLKAPDVLRTYLASIGIVDSSATQDYLDKYNATHDTSKDLIDGIERLRRLQSASKNRDFPMSKQNELLLITAIVKGRPEALDNAEAYMEIQMNKENITRVNENLKVNSVEQEKVSGSLTAARKDLASLQKAQSNWFARGIDFVGLSTDNTEGISETIQEKNSVLQKQATLSSEAKMLQKQKDMSLISQILGEEYLEQHGENPEKADITFVKKVLKLPPSALTYPETEGIRTMLRDAVKELKKNDQFKELTDVEQLLANEQYDEAFALSIANLNEQGVPAELYGQLEVTESFSSGSISTRDTFLGPRLKSASVGYSPTLPIDGDQYTDATHFGDIRMIDGTAINGVGMTEYVQKILESPLHSKLILLRKPRSFKKYVGREKTRSVLVDAQEGRFEERSEALSYIIDVDVIP